MKPSLTLAAKAARPQLPDRLLRFFNKYPPQLYSAKYTGISIAVPLTRHEAKLKRISEAETEKQANLSASASPSPSTPTSAAPSSLSSPLPLPSITTTDSPPAAPTPPQKFPPNPFLPQPLPNTARWRPPLYGLRIQADLVKMAKKHNVEALLPPGRKSSAFKEARLLRHGLRIKGTGEGQEVKGHAYERRMSETLEKRKEALRTMPRLVREWERRGHGRGWREWPRAKTK